LFSGFFDQEAHFGVGGFEVDGEAVGLERFGSGGTDGGFDYRGESRLERIAEVELFGDLEEVSDLDTGSEESDIDLAVDDDVNGGMEWS
jgi:hypothetical protein